MLENKVVPGGACNHSNFKEAVCINTDKVYDSCKDKDCLEDMRVYLTHCSQAVLDKAINVRIKKAEVIWVYIDVEPVAFNEGFFTVNIKYFFRVTFDAFVGVCKPHEIEGICSFDKKAILFGSEGKARIYSSKMSLEGCDPQEQQRTNLPKAVVEVVDPIPLSVKVCEGKSHHCCCEMDLCNIPENVCNCFDDSFVDDDNCSKKLLVTLGLFSLIRLERNVQLLVPAYDFCIPEKECVGSNDDNPCALFDKIKFPSNEFFPPKFDEFFEEEKCDTKKSCGCK
ncbi:MAG: hypothetical protein RR436_06235 [Clostridia bacterium]